MKKRTLACLVVILAVFLLSGCAGETPAEETTQQPTQMQTEPQATVPADGDQSNVTCKGSYTGTPDWDAVVARSGGGQLTNESLQAWYWSAVASYRAKDSGIFPDFSAPLDTQPCPIDDTVNSWQQYFLKQALNNWHTAQALYVMGQEEGLPVEEAYDPTAMGEYREENLVDIPVIDLMYRQETAFRPNSMHQAFLDNIPQMLDQMAQEQGYTDGNALAKEAFGTTKEALTDMIALYNQGYMYETNLSYYIENEDWELWDWYTANETEYKTLGIVPDGGKYVDFRQILLIPEESEDHPGLTVAVGEDGSVTCDEALWEACWKQAEDLVRKWTKSGRPRSESMFSDYAHSYSQDPGSAADGGAYRQVRQGQMTGVLDDWLFGERKPGEHTILRSDYGIHILYFVSSTDIWEARSREDLTASKQRQTILDARETYSMLVTYSAITLAEAEGGLPLEQLLYRDLAHERFPEVPVYLQQDYPNTMYGNYRIRTHGCGITSLAMLASYMTDEEWTPPELCDMYGHYNTEDGTDVTLFIYEPAAMGFYGYVAYKDDVALEALKEGHIVVSLQHAGYWTRGGHYIVLEKMNEDGSIQVRDSNLFNYGKLEGHKQDKHRWEDITPANKVMWVFDKKLTRIPACGRCGDRQGVTESLLNEDYLCHKCRPALLRRNTYLSVFE